MTVGQTGTSLPGDWECCPMSIETMMYFALGALASALVTLMIMPAIWRRAVRLTKKRIEAATPITMAEFRADKDQLRAEFALSTRRLEMNVEQLRKRLAEQVSDVSRRKNDFVQLKSERDEHLTIVRELEEREAELRSRLLDLEKEGTDLAQRLRMRDRELAQKSSELQNARDAIKSKLPATIRADGKALTGDYDEDIDELLTALAVERKRASFLEEQARSLITHLEKLDRKSVDTNAAIAELRRTLAKKDDAAAGSNHQLVEAEVRIANAESRLNALLEETSEIVDGAAQKHELLLAEKLSLEAQLEHLRRKISDVEAGVMSDWDAERLEQSHLRERLNDIASEVSRLVYAVDNHSTADSEESLFDRVQRFADDGLKVENFPVRNGAVPRAPANGNGGTTSVSDRMAALRELQRGN
jgi:chromosome segregation ATPase